MPGDAFSDVFFQQPAYALVIGISKYRYWQRQGDNKLLGPKNFRNLDVAAKDAKDFAKFLSDHGFFPANVALLTNKNATTKNIKIEFKKLKDSCNDEKIKDPLVIVFFAGHGMAEGEEAKGEQNHYLIPWEAERDQLDATAISNDTFYGFLNGLRAKKLVVFLDACHSGGMVGIERKGRDGTPPLSYDSSRGLGGGSGRIVIASCTRGQQSYESGKNGIFTGKLLSLLKGESPYFKDTEEIRVFALYERLREEVDRAAKLEHQQPQEPQINDVKEATGIVLAINRQARKNKEAREKRQEFRDAIINLLREMKHSAIASKLLDYIDEGDKQPAHDALYGIFDENLRDWRPGAAFVEQCCRTLINEHNRVLDSLESTKKLDTQRSSKSLDAVENKPRKTLSGSQELGTALVPTPQSYPPAPQSHQPSAKRKLSDKDSNYIVAAIPVTISYWRQRADLEACLKGPITEEEFARTLIKISSKHTGDAWDAILNAIEHRFKERWPKADVFRFESNNPLGIQSKKNKG